MFYSISASDFILSIKQVGLSIGQLLRIANSNTRSLDFAIGFASESNRCARDDKFGELPFGTAEAVLITVSGTS
jgi:hypothetical protein